MSYLLTSITLNTHEVFDAQAQLRQALKVQLLTPTSHAGWVALEVILMKLLLCYDCGNAEPALQKVNHPYRGVGQTTEQEEGATCILMKLNLPLRWCLRQLF